MQANRRCEADSADCMIPHAAALMRTRRLLAMYRCNCKTLLLSCYRGGYTSDVVCVCVCGRACMVYMNIKRRDYSTAGHAWERSRVSFGRKAAG